MRQDGHYKKKTIRYKKESNSTRKDETRWLRRKEDKHSIKEEKIAYMKQGENSYKKGRQANGNGYGNGNTDTIQTTTQNGKVSWVP